MARDSQDPGEARRLGAVAGEDFDRLLREREREERDERLSRLIGLSAIRADSGERPLAGAALTAGSEPSPLPPEFTMDRPSLDALALRREVERLTVYYDAVQNSRVWRLTQRLRRLVGRAW